MAVEFVFRLVLFAGFFLPTIIGSRRGVICMPMVVAFNLSVIGWPWALVLALNPITRDWPARD